MANEYLKRVISEFIPKIACTIPVGSNLDAAIERLVTADEFVAVIEEDKGAMFGLIYRSWWNPNEIICQELGWWVEPAYRGVYSIKLFKKFEALAKSKGATTLLATAQMKVDHAKTCQVYEKLGMAATETVYFKEL